MYSLSRNINAELPLSQAKAVGVILAHGMWLKVSTECLK